ncbi:MAG: C10 family peptidase [Candidatus Cryptobacteroides sp.]
MSSSGYIGAISEDKMIGNICNNYATFEILSSTSKYDDSSTSEVSDSPSYHWAITDQIKSKLSTLWNQDTPFNNLCPYVGILKKEQAPAGCVPIALGQIIAYNEYPELVCDTSIIDWKLIKTIRDTNNVYSLGNREARQMAQDFIFNISAEDMCSVIYGKLFGMTFGFALPTGARNCLEVLGYQNVNLQWGYDENIVIDALNNDCPVFISAIAGLVSGHAWVIDGYITRKYISESGEIKKQQHLMHCNWGWTGHNNGYFASGVFETGNPIISDGRGNTMDEKYWYAFNTITYDKP